MTKLFTSSFLSVILAALVTAPVSSHAQSGVDILLSKARSLEARGQMDLAAQNWHRVLLVNPNQTEALAGLARAAKEGGQAQDERTYLDRLRKINPHDPEIAAVENLRVFTPEERNQLDQAGRLAMQHKADDAIKIYRQVLGDKQPPLGKWAEPFYETEAESTGGRPTAISQLRQLCAQYPNQQAYRLWLASLLTYDPKTRMEGLRLIQSIDDPVVIEQARAPWRKALVWEKDNPDVLAPMQAYLQRYPDPELQPIVAALQEKQQQNAADADKLAGFKALKNKDTVTATAEFDAVLKRSPNDVNALAGLGFVRLDQKQFSEALSLFDKARALAPQRSDIQDGYNNAQFWLAMERGAAAQQRNAPAVALAAFQEALTLRPLDAGALLGTAHALTGEHKYPEAEARFQQVLNQAPNNSDALAGLGFVRLSQKRFDDAAKLFAKARSLDPGRKDLAQGYRNATFWGTLNEASTALNQNRPQAAVAEYRQALLLNPDDKNALFGLANASEHAGDFPGAAKAWTHLTATYPDDDAAWIGLMQTQNEAGDPQAAIASSQRIPTAVKQRLESRPEYPAQMAFVYYSARQQTAGDAELRNALEIAAKSDTERALDLRFRIAGRFMDEDQPGRAVEIYKQATLSQPGNPSAWEGLIGAYTRTSNFAAAINAARSMPQTTYDAALKNSGFLNSVAVLYSAQGECTEAEGFLNTSLSLDRTAGRQPAEATQLQLADIWMREGYSDSARRLYDSVVTTDPNSAEAWRGLMVALHKAHADRELVAQFPGIPPAVHAELETDADVLVLEASAETTAGKSQDAVQLLDKALALYTAHHRNPPANLDIQAAWAMLAVSPDEPGLAELLQNTRMRGDLTATQSTAVEQLWSTWSIRRAQAAFDTKPQLAFDTLTVAAAQYPRNRDIHAALASLYLRKNDNQKALDIFRTWGMAGAVAGDYRMAAGAALSLHRNEVAEQYLHEGLARFADDPQLIHMSARQDIAHGDYKEGERELESALQAMREQDASEGRGHRLSSRNLQQSADELSANAASNLAARDGAAQASVAPCRPQSARNDAGVLRLRPISLILPIRHRSGWAFQSAIQAPQSAPQTSNPAAQSAAPSAQNAQAAPAAPQQQQQVQNEIDAVSDRNTPVIGTGGTVSTRVGDPGFDHLVVTDGLLDSAIVASDQVRFSVEAHGVYASSGTPNGNSTLMYGTLPAGSLFSAQSQAGYGGIAQLSTGTFGLAAGTSPQGFPVHNVIGGIRYRPLNGWFTFLLKRDSVKDSLLSYAGARDPNTNVRWGGVVANTGTATFDSAPVDATQFRRFGEYASASYSFLQGLHVPDNWSASGNAGFYWNVIQNLSVGVNAGAMHYDKDLNFFSFGQGGYFSPQQYYLASIPISWYARHPRFEYQIKFSGGLQYLQQDASAFYPVLPGTGPVLTQGTYASSNTTSPNYNADVRLGYRVTPHIYFDTFGSANNANNYYSQSIGFGLKIMIDPVPTSTDLKINSIPDWTGTQPFSIR